MRWNLEESPFANYLDTNVSPSEQEVACIRNLLHDPERELWRMDDEISRLKSLLHDLQSQRQQLTDYISAHRALVSPFRQFPPEIISKIFMRCLPTEHDPIRSIHSAPLLLTRICKKWREIALGTPKLWSAIHISLPSIFVGNVESIVGQRQRGVERWLGLAGQIPVSLSFFSPSSEFFVSLRNDRIDSESHDQRIQIHTTSELFHPQDLREPFLSFVKTLVNFRLTSLEVYFTTLGAAILMSVPASTLRQLKVDLSTSYNCPRSMDVAEVICNVIREQPLLESIHLRNFSFDPFAKLGINWAKLTEISLYSSYEDVFPLSVRVALDVFSEAINLRYCTISISLIVTDNIPEPRIVTIPSLRYLNLHLVESDMFRPMLEDYPADVLCPLFRHLRAPSLNSFSVHASRQPGRGKLIISDHVPFLDMLSDSEFISQIKSLYLHLPISSEALTECLSFMPHLSSLVVSFPSETFSFGVGQPKGPAPIGNDLIHLLMPSEQNKQVLCPRLESLQFINCLDLSERLLVDLVKSKLYASTSPESDKEVHISKLKRLAACFLDRYNNETLVKDIEELSKKGVEIEIVYGGPKPDYDKPWQSSKTSLVSFGYRPPKPWQDLLASPGWPA
ncbi:hypothetical protein K435DRAFT_777603 [Dendrothele bispora CBS 962.96]|uniref:Uncharacterized protein n=1 Tax=Dendrothele bispora (strain CBS 962.96) TaxID=1314807 RepID=A0A4S8M7D6_DENBC|nr:hypothetical protein K435DRAFT_777603 [Dendrothele bispora CBS 962.96]